LAPLLSAPLHAGPQGQVCPKIRSILDIAIRIVPSETLGAGRCLYKIQTHPECLSSLHP
jgi:hypothetical protein